MNLNLLLSADEETEPRPRKQARLDTNATECAKDGTVWRREQVGRRVQFTPIEAYTEEGQPAAEARRNVTTRLQSFLCFITLDMLRLIRHYTVLNAEQTEPGEWFLTLHELMAFVAVVILRGILRVPALHDCWSEKFGYSRITGTMSRNRFKEIMKHLRFDDKMSRGQRAQTDKFAAISDIWKPFVQNCIASYHPGRHLTVDEQLFPTRVRCPFTQFMANKPDKFGIKFFVACDLETKYICNVIPYLGKDKSRPREERLSEHVVMSLLEPFLDKGRNVTTDNFFTSVSLAKRLLCRNTTLLGTVNKVRREVPNSARQTDRDQLTTEVCSCCF